MKKIWGYDSEAEFNVVWVYISRKNRTTPQKSRNQKTGGFGIGLSVVYAIVNAHKGKITARSDDGNSLLFTITLSS